jgi:hypothetical protein
VEIAPAIPTFPPPRPLLDFQKDETKGDILGYRLGSSPGSSFDWKTLLHGKPETFQHHLRHALIDEVVFD